MKEELTTLMHCEFCETEEEVMELLVMATYNQIENKGIKPEIALKNNNLTMEQYNANVDKVFGIKKRGLPSRVIFL
jgi:hypothetical protein